MKSIEDLINKFKDFSKKSSNLSKIFDDLYNQGSDFLKNGELNLREKANIYSGAMLGLIGPIVAARYLFFGPMLEETPEKEAVKWIQSLVIAPSVALGLPAGVFLGARSAKALKETRQEREKYNHTGLKIFDF